ncbi:phage tail protein [Candidatus Erwinia dacicola]|uniref:Tail needle protein gp26 n=1 Tax=Candidatus Erwinia dacicola TaxID=252393 RepID=A0A328TQA1_9GAMM|nr:phage tail protein [Candidatus Erwinia dacicola]RAP72789.1 tail needle protein gp26 [Candidatus Erwinia dacicola]RAP73010.1 tail needle protein gp26 [Candidatus Erwinia dacicola]
MADEPKKVIVQASRVDDSILPPGISLAYRLYIIQQGGDLKNVADASNNANDLAYQATLKNQEQDVTLADHELRLSNLRIEVDNHELRITSNTSAITLLNDRVGLVEGNVSTIQSDLSALTGRVTATETAISTLEGDYVSKSATTSQTLSSPLNVTTSYSVGGTKVIGARQTGWTAATGTALLGAFNANQSYSAGATYTQADIQALATGLMQARQRIKALEDMVRTHGLIA